MTTSEKLLPSEALGRFVFHRAMPPYWDGLQVMPAKCKTGYGAARRTMLVHRVKAMAAVFVGDQVRFGARWVCGDGSVDAVIVQDPNRHGSLCPRCAAHDHRAPVLYRYFSADGCLLYVGSTTNFAIRDKQHAQRASWWPEVASVRTEPYSDIDHARSAEAAAIRKEDPRHNKILRRLLDSGTPRAPGSPS